MELLGNIAAAGPDGLLATLKAFQADARPEKIDLGIGVYKDEHGATPVMRAVKQAEERLLRSQSTKAYLGADGDAEFAALVGRLAMGDEGILARSAFVQTPGGTGALRLAAEIVARSASTRRVIIGTPTWINHIPICRSAGLSVVEVPVFDVATQQLDVSALLAAIGGAGAGDAILLQICCNNPHGSDPAPEQWQAIARQAADRGVLPILDLAYQGLGDGLEADSVPLRIMLSAVPEALVAISCSKNFGLYRERTGVLGLVGREAGRVAGARALALGTARTSWSMPPDHGAAIVRTILQDEALASTWGQELDGMRLRLETIRAGLSASLGRVATELSAIARQKGMFALLPLTPASIARLRERDGIYAAPDGRINIAGLTLASVDRAATALARELDRSMR